MILNDRAHIAKAVNASTISLDEAPQGYQEFGRRRGEPPAGTRGAPPAGHARPAALGRDLPGPEADAGPADRADRDLRRQRARPDARAGGGRTGPNVEAEHLRGVLLHELHRHHDRLRRASPRLHGCPADVGHLRDLPFGDRLGLRHRFLARADAGPGVSSGSGQAALRPQGRPLRRTVPRARRLRQRHQAARSLPRRHGSAPRRRGQRREQGGLGGTRLVPRRHPGHARRRARHGRSS